MAITRVQAVFNNAVGATTTTFAAIQTARNLNVLFIFTSTAGQAITAGPTDSRKNIYTLRAGPFTQAGWGTCWIYDCVSIVQSAVNNAVTVTCGAATTELFIAEYKSGTAGGWVVDGIIGVGTNGNAATMTTPNIVTSGPSDLLWTGLAGAQGQDTTASGFTAVTNDAAGVVVGERLGVVPGTYLATGAQFGAANFVSALTAYTAGVGILRGQMQPRGL